MNATSVLGPIIEDIFNGHSELSIHRETMETAIENAITGLFASMMTSEEVAVLLRISPRRVRAKALSLKRRGIKVGWQVPGTSHWLFLNDDLKTLASPLQSGRPRKQTT